jgi:exonuclease III
MSKIKVISLNTWRGKLFDELIEFIREKSYEKGVFCFQEIFSSEHNILYKGFSRLNLLEELKEVLFDFDCYFAPTHGSVYEDASFTYGNAIFVRKSLDVIEHSYFFTYGFFNSRIEGATSNDSRNFQCIKLRVDDEDYTICNFHGVWIRGFGKEDNEERILQSETIKSFLRDIKGKKIICGDFNLLPDTMSIKLLEEDLINLIKVYDVETTRSSFYTRDAKFADYVFVSSEVEIVDFNVLEDEVSDHLPLEFSFR